MSENTPLLSTTDALTMWEQVFIQNSDLDDYFKHYGREKVLCLHYSFIAERFPEIFPDIYNDAAIESLIILANQTLESLGYKDYPKALEGYVRFSDHAPLDDMAKKIHQEAITQKAEKVKSESAIDVFYLDENGRRRINWETLIHDIMENFIFRTIEDTEELLVYNNGTYHNGRTAVKRYVEEALSDDADLHAIREIIGHIQRRTYIPREVVNGNTDFIPIGNGLLNLDTLALESFDSNKIYTFQLPASFDPNAGFEHIEEFFKEILNHDDIQTMQEIFGYALYPKQPAHKLFWWIGTGRNGKTTTSELLRSMMGIENDAGVPLVQLDGHHRFSVARLFGKLINIVPEPETQTILQTPLLKAATGGDILHGEMKGIQSVFPFLNFAKFIIYANDIPQIADTSYGFWQRALVIDFPFEFTEGTAIKNYHETLIKQDGVSGILNWALIGLKRLRDNNWEFTRSSTQDAAKGRMQRRAQPVKTFLDEWTKFGNLIEIPKTILYEAFKLYCDLHIIPTLDEGAYISQLKQHANIRERRSVLEDFGRVRTWQGLQFKDEIRVVKTLVNGVEVSADEALEAGRVNLEFKDVALLPYLTCPTCPQNPSIIYSLCVGGKRVIIENKEILPLYIDELKNAGITGVPGNKKGNSIENNGNHKLRDPTNSKNALKTEPIKLNKEVI